MKLSFVSILILLTLLNPSAYAQEIKLTNRETFLGTFTPIARNIDYSDVEGSPYLDEELIQGAVVFTLGDSSVEYLRYNIYDDEIEYLKGDKLMSIVNNEVLKRVYIDGHVLYYKTYKVRNKFEKGFLEKLAEGHCELYIKYDVDFQKAEEALTPYHEPKPDRFVTKAPTYYFSYYKEPIIDFELDNSGLQEIGGDYYEDLKKYMKANKLKLRKEEDLIELFKYFNTLLKDPED